MGKQNWNSLTDEEKLALLARTPIAPDDDGSPSTAAGWEKFQAELRERRSAPAPDVSGGVFWAVSLSAAALVEHELRAAAAREKGREPPPEPDRAVRFFECERFFDVRRVAETILGGDVSAARVGPSIPSAPLPRYQVRWTGSAVGHANLRRQVRELDAGGGAGPWRDAA
jgi:hypothetical protein